MAILGYKSSSQLIRTLGLEEWLKTRGLPGWLEIATDNLEAPSKQRIEREIEAHYAEAISAHMTAGEPEFSAQATALAELGDPREAALNFRKRYLTEDEVKSIHSMERTAAQPLFSFRTVPVMAIDISPLAGLVLLCSPVREIPSFRLLAIVMLITFGGFRLVPRLLWTKNLSKAYFLRGFALSMLITETTFAVAYALVMYPPHHDIFPVALMFCVWVRSFKPKFRILRKLRKSGYDQNEFPPQQTSAF